MRNPCSRFIVAGGLFLLIASVASSKLPLSSLLISGGRLSQSIKVTDPKLLQASNPWFGTFIPQWNVTSRQQVARPPETAPRYEILFYATLSAKDPPHVVYVAYYVFDSASHRGFLYLPGHHESGYSRNSRSILRPNQDGRWNLADPAWCDEINSMISRSRWR